MIEARELREWAEDMAEFDPSKTVDEWLEWLREQITDAPS